MSIVVTGGVGFIGSHIVVELIEQGHEVIVLDNFSNSSPQTLQKLRQMTDGAFEFYPIDVTDYHQLEQTLTGRDIEGIIHLSGFKSISQSLHNPLAYYYNNVVSTINLLRFMDENQVEKLVFSSSATVYGDGEAPFRETDPCKETTNPYGESKKVSERVIKDYAATAPDKQLTILRYFNPIGAHPSGVIGEESLEDASNILPLLLDVAMGKRSHLDVYGDDFPTPDGTGIRDYIHVVDLAKAHIAALEKAPFRLNIYNVGTGKGSSVLDLIKTFERVNQMTIPYLITNRRPGDIAISYADVTKIRQEIGWQADLSLENMVRDAWNFRSNQREV